MPWSAFFQQNNNWKCRKMQQFNDTLSLIYTFVPSFGFSPWAMMQTLKLNGNKGFYFEFMCVCVCLWLCVWVCVCISIRVSLMIYGNSCDIEFTHDSVLPRGPWTVAYRGNWLFYTHTPTHPLTHTHTHTHKQCLCIERQRIKEIYISLHEQKTLTQTHP